MSWMPSWNPFKKKEAPGTPMPASPTQAAPAQPEAPAEAKGMMAAFYRKWKDPAFIKQLKTLAAYMERDGINIKDMGQVKGWLEKNKHAIDSGRFKELPASGEKQETYVKTGPDVGRNEPCPCSSGKKYKKCCAGKNL